MRLPKYSDDSDGAGGDEAPLNLSLVSSPNAELYKDFRASDVRPSRAKPSEGGGDSSPNFEGTDAAIGP
jgi:hypothetical protein